MKVSLGGGGVVYLVFAAGLVAVNRLYVSQGSQLRISSAKRITCTYYRIYSHTSLGVFASRYHIDGDSYGGEPVSSVKASERVRSEGEQTQPPLSSAPKNNATSAGVYL